MAVTKQETSIERPVTGKARKQGVPIASLVLGVLSGIGMMLSIWMIFLYAPTDAVQGPPQRIFYFHVPVAWIGMLSFCLLALAGIVYIITKDERWDWFARASAEVGLVFITFMLVTGSIWGKIIWGTWWAWDPKLTASLILWFMVVAYIMLRSYMGRSNASAYAGAVLAIVGVVDVPIIYLSVQWWRGLHPTSEVSLPETALPPSVVLTLMVALVTFTLLFSFLMIQVYQLQRLQGLAQRLRAIVE